MNFVNPLMLTGALLAAVPIVLHLLMRPRPRRLEFPALRFVRRGREANRRRMRLRHLLLLASRVGVIVLLAGAMARPSIRPPGAGGRTTGPVAAALVFDTAPRMQYRHQNQTRLDEAQELARWIVGELPDESQAAVLETRPSSAVFQVDLGAANERIQRLQTSAVNRPLERAIDDAITLLVDSDRPRKEIYVFTDLSRSAWQVSSPRRLQERIERLAGGGIYIVDVGVDEPRNVGLGSLALASERITTSGTIDVEVDVFGEAASDTCAVELVLTSVVPPEKRSQRDVTLEPGRSTRVELSAGGLDVGTHQGEVRIVGGDALAADDVRYFTVEVAPPARVLLVAPEPAEDNAFLMEQALAPSLLARTGRARFECAVISPSELSSVSLSQYQAVCLLDPAPLDAKIWARLSGYVAQGGGLAVFLGRRATPVKSFNQDTAQELLPAELSRQVRRPDGDAFFTIDRPDHPLWNRFRRLSQNVPWQQFPVYRYWQVDPATDEASVLARYSDGGPALLERTLGQGRVLLMTTPVSDVDPKARPWNVLPTGFEPWPFVMLVNEAMLYLVGDVDTRLNYMAGQTAVLPTDAEARWSTYVLSVPGSDSFRQTIDRGRQAIVVAATDRPGNYRVRAGGVAEGIDRGFSVNLDPSATDLARLEPSELEGLLGEDAYAVVDEREDIERRVSRGRVGRNLDGPLILLLVLVLAVEHVLANRFYRGSATSADFVESDADDSPPIRRGDVRGAPQREEVGVPA